MSEQLDLVDALNRMYTLAWDLSRDARTLATLAASHARNIHIPMSQAVNNEQRAKLETAMTSVEMAFLDLAGELAIYERVRGATAPGRTAEPKAPEPARTPNPPPLPTLEQIAREAGPKDFPRTKADAGKRG